MTSLGSVIVVGGGISGLTAARELARRSVRVTVLESSERVGGRTCAASSSLLPVAVDAGGQWVGAKQSAIQEVVRELQIKLAPQYCSGKRVIEIASTVRTYSGLIPNVSMCQLVDAQFALLFLGACQLLLWLCGDDSAIGRWASATTMQRILERFMCTRGGRALLHVVVLGLFGHDPASVSLLAFCRYVNANDSVEKMAEIGPGSVQAWTCVGGTQQISERLAQQVRAAGGQIVFGQRVTDVQRLADGSAAVRVVCQSGAVYNGGGVVVAIPPPLVARIAFSPVLPSHRAQLLCDATMGCIIKASVLYRTAFWRAAGFSGEVVCDTMTPAAGPAFNVFDACVPVPVASLDPSNPQGILYAGPTISDPAVRLGPEFTYIPALVVFINGERAREWSAVDAPSRRSAVLAQLERWFGREAGQPLEYIEKDWAADEHTGGCPIATYGADALTRFGLAQRLAEPCWPAGAASPARPAPCLLQWAGTESADVGTGFMDGAVRAGRRAAAAIYDTLQATSGATGARAPSSGALPAAPIRKEDASGVSVTLDDAPQWQSQGAPLLLS